MMAYLKNAPMKSQEINGLKFTLIGGYKKNIDTFYFKLNISNISAAPTRLTLEKPFLKYIVERDNAIVYETDFAEFYNYADTIDISINMNEKKEFVKNIKMTDLKFETGAYKLIALLFNNERYQIITDFKISGSYQ